MAPANKNGVPHGYASRVCCGVKDAMTEAVKRSSSGEFCACSCDGLDAHVDRGAICEVINDGCF